MKKQLIILVLFVLGTALLLAACNVQPSAPINQSQPIESQANAWQLLGTSLDVAKSLPARNVATAVTSNGNPVMTWMGQESSMGTYSIYVKRWTGRDWQQLGTTLDVNANTQSYEPDIALGKTGNPVVAWEEDTATNGRHVYVKRWNGATWIQLGATLKSTTSKSAQNPSIAIDTAGNPVVALFEDTGVGTAYNHTIYVKRWNGTSWLQLGSALDINLAKGAYYPSLALDSSGNPIVAWEEYDGNNSNIYVKRWNGSAWVQMGGALDVTLADPANSPSLEVDSSGKPVVTWQEGFSTQMKVYVKRWTGTTWSQVGTTPLNITATQSAETPSLALDAAGQPVVAWQEFYPGGFYNIYVRRWTGTAWVVVGANPLEVKISNYAMYPSLALDSVGNPVVAWEECDASQIGPRDCLKESDLYVKRFTANGWQPFGRAIDVNVTNESYNSSLARKSNDRPVVTWQEANNVYVKEWTGTTWALLGNKLNTNGGQTPVIAMRSDDKPVVAWSENGSQVFVKFWNGSSWQSQGSVSANTIQSFALAVGSANNPIVAYSALGNDGEASNLYLKRWNGTAWIGMNGSTTVTPLDIDLSKDAGVPALAVDSTGKPAVAWLEFGVGIQSIYVKQWNGATWVQLGANLETFPANNPSIDIDSTGKPVVAWEERVFDNGNVNTNIYAKRWSGSSWQRYENTGNFTSTFTSGQMVDKLEGNNAYEPSLQLRSDGIPVIAITQTVMRDGMTSFDIYVRRWLPSQGVWIDVGVPADDNIAFSAKSPSLVLRSNNHPLLSWDEFDGSSSNIYVRQY
jgi:hypothetical protein